MKLLRASSVKLEEFTPSKVPRYAILSHTWGDDEIVTSDILNGDAQKRKSWPKVQSACQRTMQDGLEFIWIDTCCIDKTSSAELSEALNSMYVWYQRAEICYAYLEDVPADVDPGVPGSAFDRARWMTRGWTLQELLAPSEVIFLAQNWAEVGKKSTLSNALSRITAIDEETLMHRRPISSASIARRMAWASHRQTTRPEDIAYCLMGIFSVNMPMLYGEGDRAFIRLQEEIMKQSDDHSIFAWVDRSAPSTALRGLLATSPANFSGCHQVIPYQTFEPRQAYSMTNKGLQISLPLVGTQDGTYIALLDCPSPTPKRSPSFLGLFLKRVSAVDNQYARIKAGVLAEVHELAQIKTIYVRQLPSDAEILGAFPNHFVRIRSIPPPVHYRLAHIFVFDSVSKISTDKALRSVDEFAAVCSRSYQVYKEERSISFCLAFVRVDGLAIAVVVGSKTGLDLAFDARP